MGKWAVLLSMQTQTQRVKQNEETGEDASNERKIKYLIYVFKRKRGYSRR